MSKKILIVIVLMVIGFGCSKDENKTEFKQGLTDKQLAIQRWFSYLTFMQDRNEKSWKEFYDDGNQIDVTAFRYQLAFCSYGCAAMAGQTPAYRQLIEKQMFDLCQRMIDYRCWPYVTKYWDYRKGAVDPAKYENVMYTAHLTQMMCLYEHFTGDMVYSEKGWDFVDAKGRKTHYNLEKAIQRLHVQSVNEPTGGIPCEPNQIFATCNSHSAISFMLFDLIHGTGYEKANEKWFKWMTKHFLNKVPLTREFMYIRYNNKLRVFTPMGDVGADCWTLGWGYPWFSDTAFAKKGLDHIKKFAKWYYPTENQAYAKNSKVIGCCGGGSLNVANSFLPLLAVQVEGAESETAKKSLNWLEAKLARAIDTDGDGYKESYYYHSCQMHKISATANIATALATDGDSLRKLYQTSRENILTEPTLKKVDYPNVYVRAAEYIEPVLRFVVLKAKPSFTGETEIVCSQIPIKSKVTVTRDGKKYTKFKRAENMLTILTNLETERVFEVKINTKQLISN